MMRLGDFVGMRRSFTREDLQDLADMSGAEPGNTVPEPLLAALISYLLGVKLPGPGTNYLKQELTFPNAAPLETELVAKVEVTRLREDKRIADLWASVTLADGTIVAEGRSLVKYADTNL